MTVATLDSSADDRRRATSSSATWAPAATSVSIAPASIVSTSRSPGASARTSSTVAAFASFSTTSTLTSASVRIQDTCSADDVS